MTFLERVDAMIELGFKPRNATFLTMVLLHGGFFVRRQYHAFAGVSDSQGCWILVNHLLAHRLVRPVACSIFRGHVHQLFGRVLYATVDAPAFRGRASPDLIARRVMLLDFVLSELTLEWYATPADKCDLFARRLGVPENVFPQRTHGKIRTRYWPQDLPIFVTGRPPVVNFVCLTVDPRASEIGTFVREHAALLRYVSGWTLHVVAPPGAVPEVACESAYERALDVASLAPLVADEDREWFARTQPLVDQGDLTTLTVADLHRYRELESRIRRSSELPAAGPLVMHLLPNRYRAFEKFVCHG